MPRLELPGDHGGMLGQGDHRLHHEVGRPTLQLSKSAARPSQSWPANPHIERWATCEKRTAISGPGGSASGHRGESRAGASVTIDYFHCGARGHRLDTWTRSAAAAWP